MLTRKPESGAEQDVEKAEQSTKPDITRKDIENPESSTKPSMVVKSPKLLRKSDGSSCIFRIPRSLRKIHHKGYAPEIVSIGPYYHNKKHLEMIEEHKHRFLELFLSEATNGDVSKASLVEKILSMETDIRNSYSEELVGFNQQQLADMMLLDGCFILMLFFFVTRKIDAKEKSPNDPILTTPWILPTIRSDLLLLENQVPFILLKTLFEASNKCSVGSGSLNDLAFDFFDLSMHKPEGFWKNHTNSEAKHLLDLIRATLILKQSKSSQNATTTTSSSNRSQSSVGLILSARRLRLQGIKFKASNDSRVPQEQTILDIQLHGAEIRIPHIAFDEFISSLLLNCVIFEQLYMNCPNEITSYIVFMGCLMNDEEDAAYLSEKGIIENYFGSWSEVCQFFKSISNGVAFDMGKSYLETTFKGINTYTSNTWNVEYATFKHIHFDSPWTCMSSSAVLAILLLTMFQAFMAGLAYFKPPETGKGPQGNGLKIP